MDIKEFAMMSNSELETKRNEINKKFDSLKAKCVKYSEQMTDLAKQFREINNILDKRNGK